MLSWSRAKLSTRLSDIPFYPFYISIIMWTEHILLDIQGPNILLDDSLSVEVDKNLLNAVKDSIVQG
jgi:hypothetical protein